jgi:hypothetical protein
MSINLIVSEGLVDKPKNPHKLRNQDLKDVVLHILSIFGNSLVSTVAVIP